MKQIDKENLFTRWGAQQRRLPERSMSIKQRVLAELSQAPRRTMSPSYHLPWLSFAFTGLAVLMVFVATIKTPVSIPVSTIMSIDQTTSLSVPSAEPASDGSFSAKEMAQDDVAVAPRMAAPSAYFGPENQNSGGSASAQPYGAPVYQKSMIAPEYMPVPYPDRDASVPITDSREFLKTDYSSRIQTRDVEGLTQRIVTTVRGFDGRVDSLTSAQKFGFISFALPATKFDAFKLEIESLVSPRFITTEVRTENLLQQKQSIEEQKIQTEKTASELKSQRSRIISEHNRVIASIQSRLGTIAYELGIVRSEYTNDPARRAYLTAREKELVSEQATLEARVVRENASYGRQLNSIDAQILSTQNDLAWVATQDKELIDTVATVRGTISLNWISIWEVIKLYIAPAWMAVIFVAAALVSYFLHRRRYSPQAA